MGFDLFLAWRFLKEARTQTVLTLLAITIGVGVQVFLSSLITGLQANLLDSTVGNSAHIVVAAKADIPQSLLRLQSNPGSGPVVSETISWIKQDENLNNWQPIVAEFNKNSEITVVSPVVNEPAFLQVGGANRSIIIKGINPESADLIYKYQERMVKGDSRLSGGNEVLIGQDLAIDLNLLVGDSVHILTGQGTRAIFTIKGIFDLGVKGLNSSWVLMDLGRSQSFLNLSGAISGVELQIHDVFASESLVEGLRKKWPDLEIESWQSANKQLLSGLKSQSSSSLVIQFFVQLAVLLGISSVLAVSVVQKSKLIGILKAMGLRKQRVGRVFLLQGAMLGVFGSLLGCITGYTLIISFLFFTSASGSAVTFDVPLQANIFLTGSAVATLSSILAAFLPARRAASFNPIEVIRNG